MPRAEIVATGGGIYPAFVDNGNTFNDLLRATGLSMDGQEARRNSKVIGLEAPVNEGDVFFLVPVKGIKGGRRKVN